MGPADPIQAWADAVRRGDRMAASKLLAVYHPVLRTRAAARMDGTLRARQEPEDVLQQVYLKVVRQLDRFEGPDADAFLNWVLTILDHTVIDDWRAAHRQAREIDRQRPAVGGAGKGSSMNLLDQLYARTGTPSRFIRKDEALDAVLACVSGLPERHRRVIQLRFLRGLSVGDVAACLHTTKPAVVGRTKRALDALRKSMDALGEFTHGG